MSCDLGTETDVFRTDAVRFLPSARRPPVEETASFLKSLLASHGPNYLEKLFGAKARDALLPLGGVEAVAVALSGQSECGNEQCSDGTGSLTQDHPRIVETRR